MFTDCDSSSSSDALITSQTLKIKEVTTSNATLLELVNEQANKIVKLEDILEKVRERERRHVGLFGGKLRYEEHKQL